jgi:peptidoglycan/LPS O-acetylase OafA/YrhL
LLKIVGDKQAEAGIVANDPHRIDELTGLRAIAALSVLVAHALDASFSYGGHLWTYHGVASRLAYFGMSLFFVLSGFVIEFNYAKTFRELPLGSATRRFFVARFSRLYPLYALSILLVLKYFPSPLVDGWGPILSYLTLTQSWFNVQLMLFPPDWSISTEWFFYVAFVPLTFVIAKIKRPLLSLTIWLAVTPVLLSWVLGQKDALRELLTPLMWHGERLSADVIGWATYLSPYLRFLEFVAGVLAAKVYRNHGRQGGNDRGNDRWADRLAWCCVAWFLIVIIPANLTKGILADITSNFIFAPAIALLLVVLSCYRPTIGQWLAARPLVYLGEISYSIYIWSWFAMTLLGDAFSSRQPSALAYVNSSIKVVMIVGITIVFAAGSYQIIEVPGQRLLRKWMTGKQRRTEPARARMLAEGA